MRSSFAGDVVGGVQQLVLRVGRAGEKGGKRRAGEDEAVHDVSLNGSMDFRRQTSRRGHAARDMRDPKPAGSENIFYEMREDGRSDCAWRQAAAGHGKKTRNT